MKLKINQKFKWFSLGIFFTLFVAAIVIPQYSNYISSVQTLYLLRVFKESETAKSIEHSLLNKQNITNQRLTIDDIRVLDYKQLMHYYYINELGEVFLKYGNEGQTIFLKPRIVDGGIEWQCIAGSDRDVRLSDCNKDLLN